ncbi:hypothetical protein [Paucibacter soli]|uniref:hypothetical protein n=1 Tax=Paucibacter soli TaxID=3133433 RepID=UPI0030B4A4B8
MPAEKHSREMLRKRRTHLLEAATLQDMRSRYGPELAAIVSKATGTELSVDAFDHNAATPSCFEWPVKVEDAPGLALAYVGRAKAKQLLECLALRLRAVRGRLGFHDKRYFGLSSVIDVPLCSLLLIAEAANDSPILYLEYPQGAILVDYYQSPGSEPYSVMIQGTALVSVARECFEHAIRPLKSPT